MKKYTHTLSIIAITTFFTLPDAHAYVWQGADYVDFFGSGLSISGDKVFVGAYNDNTTAHGGGAVYVFDASTGEQDHKLFADDGDINDALGYSSAIYGNIAVAGATRNSATAYWSGAVYVYDAITGEQKFKLQTDDSGNNALFGSSVGIYENTIVVGAAAHRGNGSNAGAAYLYDANTGEQILKLTPDDAGINQFFGNSSAIYKNTVVIGAQGHSEYRGAAYIFDSVTGQQLFRLMADDGAEEDYFGTTLDVYENTVVVGASGVAEKSGAVYVFNASSGVQQFKLTADDGQRGDGFGGAVAISGETAIIGAYGNGEEIYGAGAAYMFDAGTGEQILKLTVSKAQEGDFFGSNVDIDGDNFVVSGSKVYSGSLSAMTTLDDGTSKLVSDLSFRSNVDWIVGENKSGNKVTLGEGDSADLDTAGKSVYIGKNAGSSNNRLIIAGTLNAGAINVGAVGGNRENFIHFAASADYSAVQEINLAMGNGIIFDQVWTDYSDIFNFLGSTELKGYDNIIDAWVDIELDNYLRYLDFSRSSEGQLVAILVPEPMVCTALFGALALAFAAYRRKS